MLATNLSDEIWNAIADLVNRQANVREIYFVQVVKTDTVRKLVWAKDFGDIAIPLVSHNYSFATYDTQPTSANVVAGSPLPTKLVKREDKTQQNPALHVEIITPKKGDTIVVLDPWGAKRFPICIGVVQSKGDYWEEAP